MAFQIFRRAAGDAPAVDRRSTTNEAKERSKSDEERSLLAPNAKATGIDVSEQQSAVSASLQTAALLFANKQYKEALATLAEAIEREDARVLSTWLAYLDLLRRADDRTRFDETALKFVVQFERSAPSWDELSSDPTEKVPPIAGQAAFLTMPHTLTGERPATVLSLIAQSKKPKTADSRLSIDARELREIDAPAALALAQALTAIRRQKWTVEWNGLKEFSDLVWKPLRAGEAKMPERWILGLELLVWMGRERDFEDRAVDYAVTFERSPPSWEAPTAEQLKWSMGAERAIKASEMSWAPIDTSTEVGSSVQKIAWSGVMAGPNDPQLKRLLSPTQKTERVELSMHTVRHVDFVCAGAISNGILRVMASGRDVTIFGASPIIRALLQITGVPENLFVARKRG